MKTFCDQRHPVGGESQKCPCLSPPQGASLIPVVAPLYSPCQVTHVNAQLRRTLYYVKLRRTSPKTRETAPINAYPARGLAAGLPCRRRVSPLPAFPVGNRPNAASRTEPRPDFEVWGAVERLWKALHNPLCYSNPFYNAICITFIEAFLYQSTSAFNNASLIS